MRRLKPGKGSNHRQRYGSQNPEILNWPMILTFKVPNPPNVPKKYNKLKINILKPISLRFISAVSKPELPNRHLQPIASRPYLSLFYP